MTIERGQIKRATSKLLQRLLLTSKDIKRTSMQMPHALSRAKERHVRLWRPEDWKGRAKPRNGSMNFLDNFRGQAQLVRVD